MKLKLTAALLLATPALADQPQPLPMPPAIPAPQDVAYPGTISLTVDIRDFVRHVVAVHESIPVQKAGDLILLYPEWVPGGHGPRNPLASLAGLFVHAGGRQLDWVRDTVDVNAFHVPVPAGATTVEVDFEYLSPPTPKEGRVEMTPEIVDLAWIETFLYPAGYFLRGITVAPTLSFVRGWGYATALETANASDGHVDFKPTKLDVLADSPVYAGRYFTKVDLAPGAKVPVHVDVFADKPADLVMSDEQVAKHRALVAQATKLFGAQHYGHYDFLFSLSNELGGNGLEHHQSSEDGVDRGYFTDWESTSADRDLLPHEYTHSWNGKFRRPADLWTPNLNVPMRDSLLWVYEGQTQFWGQVLAARSGLWSKQEALDAIALDADSMILETGRLWRPMEDTTNDPIINGRRPQAWHSWERQEDYYTEGLLIWLDADTLIRQQTKGAKSMNDFARAFFGMEDGNFSEKTYTFDDLVAALNGVMPYDWAKFLHARVDAAGTQAPIDGITRGGYKLVYTDTPSAFQKSAERRRKMKDFSDSLGFSMDSSGGTVNSVIWGSPAFRAGLVKGAKIIAVNSLAYDGASDIEDAVKQAKASHQPVDLLVQVGSHFRVTRIPYFEGLRYPHLERVAGVPALLDDVLAPLK
jgi:predicted metalloprotease with PDZ domain